MLSDEDYEAIAKRVAEEIQGNNGTDEAVTLALIDQKLKRICPMVEEDHDKLAVFDSLPGRVTRLEGYLMGLGGLQVVGLALMGIAVRMGWL